MHTTSGRGFHLFAHYCTPSTWNTTWHIEHAQWTLVEFNILIMWNWCWYNDVRWWYPVRFFKLLPHGPSPFPLVHSSFLSPLLHNTFFIIHDMLTGNRTLNLAFSPLMGLPNFVPNLELYVLTHGRASPSLLLSFRPDCSCPPPDLIKKTNRNQFLKF